MDATWIKTTFVLIDTAMTILDHQTDVRTGVPDSEVVTVALVEPSMLPIIIGFLLISCNSCSMYLDQSVILDCIVVCTCYET
jgi:hypothetical protein